MVPMHGWRQCRPDLRRAGPRLAEAVTRVWTYLRDSDRSAYHRYTCMGRRSSQDGEVVTNIHRQIRAEAGQLSCLEVIAEFGLEATVNDNPEFLREIFALGLGVPLRPQGRAELLARTGSTAHLYYVIRVRDIDAITRPPDARYAAYLRRRRIAPCADCGLDCYYDPLGLVAAEGATMLCTPCVRWRLVVEHRR